MKQNSSLYQTLALGIILVGAVMRFYAYDSFSYFNDELSALTRLRFDRVSDLISQGVRIDGHPAGVQVFLYYWVKIFGWSELSVRFPFVLSGVLSLLLFYRLAKTWFNKNTALFALVLLSFLIFPILYSRIARPYSPGLFFSLLMLNGWTSYLFGSAWLQRTYWFHRFMSLPAFVIGAVACMYTHYFSFLFMILVSITGIFYLNRKTWKSYVMAGVIIALSALPHLEIFLFQFSVGGVGGPDGWLGKPESDALWTHIYYTLNESVILILIVGTLVLYSIFSQGEKVKMHRFHFLSILFFLVPFLVGYFYSLYRNPVLQNSVLLFSFPCLLMLLFSFFSSELKSKAVLLITFLLSFVSLGSTIVEKKFYTTEHFGVFKELAEAMVDKGLALGFNNICYSTNVNGPFYIDYYLHSIHEGKNVQIEQYKCNEEIHLKAFNTLVAKSKQKYFMHSWSNIYNPVELDLIIRTHYPYVLDAGRHFNSGWVIYSRDSADNFISVPRVVYFETFDSTSIIDASFIRRDSVDSNSYVLMDSAEYGPTWTTPVQLLPNTDTIYIRASCQIQLADTSEEVLIVMSVEKNGESLFWRGVDVSNRCNNCYVPETVFAACDIRSSFPSDAVLKVFIWNKNKQKIMMDDFKIEITTPY